MKALEKQLTALKEKEKKEKETLTRLEADLDNLKTKAMTERTELEELEAQLAEVKKDAQVGFYRSLFYIDITLSEFYLTFEDFGILKTSNSKK